MTSTVLIGGAARSKAQTLDGVQRIGMRVNDNSTWRLDCANVSGAHLLDGCSDEAFAIQHTLRNERSSRLRRAADRFFPSARPVFPLRATPACREGSRFPRARWFGFASYS